jgi:hypothetical protein
MERLNKFKMLILLRHIFYGIKFSEALIKYTFINLAVVITTVGPKYSFLFQFLPVIDCISVFTYIKMTEFNSIELMSLLLYENCQFSVRIISQIKT